jgi:hypothetical protein
VISWPIAKFHTYEELTAALEGIGVPFESIGRTPEGRELWCATHGEGERALLITANAHAVEYAGSCCCLDLLQQPAPKDVKLYIVPRIAADGADYTLRTMSRERVRSRFMDVDVINTMTPKDINSDGRILSMRWPADDGTFVQCPCDPRLMLAKQDDDDGPFYHVIVEGDIHAWDGSDIQVPQVHCDFNRDYPSSTWTVIDRTGMGDQPLTQPETRAIVQFVQAHDDLAGAIDLHTGNPAIFYPLSAPNTGDDPVRHIGKLGEAITGFPYLISYDEARCGKCESETPGTFYDWFYETTGHPAYVVELGMFYNYIGFTTADLAMPVHEHARKWGKAMLRWHDEHPTVQLFYDWLPFDHPQLGCVEIGGWDVNQWSNPPLKEMTKVCERVGRFAHAFAERIS